MNIKEIIDAERWNRNVFDPEGKHNTASVHNASLDRIEAKASDLMFPTVRKIWVDVDGSVRIDFTGDWHIAMRDCHLSQLIKEATDPLHKRIAKLEEQNLNMMALFRDFYDLEFNRDECWEIIKKYGGDA